MSGETTVIDFPKSAQKSTTTLQRVMLTPKMATELLEHNTHNRPIRDRGVKRIAQQIAAGKWHYNGDTIKISKNNGVLDGQHRLWAVIEANRPVETIIVSGIEPEAFATIDTIRQLRSGGDLIALKGQVQNRHLIATALKWLLRWQRGVMMEYRALNNIIENSDVEDAFDAHPGMVHAVEKVRKLRTITNPALMAFLYYVTANRNPDLADEFVDIMVNPSGVGVTHPIFGYRAWLLTDKDRAKDQLTILAVGIKALNATVARKRITSFQWRTHGSRPEAFPELEV